MNMMLIDPPSSTDLKPSVRTLRPTDIQLAQLVEAAANLPDIDWERQDLSQTQLDYCARLMQSGPAELKMLLEQLQQSFATDGALIVNIQPLLEQEHGEELTRRALMVLSYSIGNIFSPFKVEGLFHKLGVNPNAKALRGESLGYIPFHIDMDQATLPPDFITLFCVRPDPYGGGANLLVDYQKLFADFRLEELQLLAGLEFSYASLYNVFGVGEEFNPHPVLEFNRMGQLMCRYNGKARPSLPENSFAAHVFDRLEVLFKAASQSVTLDQGDLLFVDQHRFLHAREALTVRTPDQTPPPEQDRLLWQFYLRARNSESQP